MIVPYLDLSAARLARRLHDSKAAAAYRAARGLRPGDVVRVTSLRDCRATVLHPPGLSKVRVRLHQATPVETDVLLVDIEPALTLVPGV